MFLAYPYNQELGNKYIVSMGNRLIQVSEILVVCFVRQNLVLGFVGQSFVFGLVEYISFVSLGAGNSIFGCPKIIGYSLVVK
jgi:uncharacterized membrane protein required for colicin V production